MFGNPVTWRSTNIEPSSLKVRVPPMFEACASAFTRLAVTKLVTTSTAWTVDVNSPTAEVLFTVPSAVSTTSPTENRGGTITSAIELVLRAPLVPKHDICTRALGPDVTTFRRVALVPYACPSRVPWTPEVKPLEA